MNTITNNVHKPQTKYLNEIQTSEILGISLSKLQQDRFYCRGIPYIKMGRLIRYSSEDISAYMDAHRVSHGG